MKHQRVLQLARKKAGMPQMPKGDVMRYICEQMGVEMPASWKARYQLMRKWAVPEQDQQKKPPKPVVLASQPQGVKGESRRKRKQAARAQSDAFLESYEWRRLRMEVLVERGARCECCGATPKDGVRMNVDHVKPRKLFPELALTKANLQVLCDVCNHGKGNWDQTDWRQDSSPAEPTRPQLVKRA